MNVKRLCVSAVIPLLFGATMAMAAGTRGAAGTTTSRVLRVLVGVNSSGKVVLVKPASSVRPAVRQAVLRTLDRAITQPARDATGKAVPSSFVVKFSQHTAPAANGTHKIDLAYVSIKALPAGSWTWCRAGVRPARLTNVTKRSVVCYRPILAIRYPPPFGSMTRVALPATHR